MSGLPWRLRRPVPPGGKPWLALAQAWDLSESCARLAWLRGCDQPEELAWRLDPVWSRTHDPYLLADMGAAVARIRQAIAGGEKICVYGDYDVDGVTATALLVRVLEKLGAQVQPFIPNRFNDGYGLHLDCIQEVIARDHATLLISVDCGVRSLEEVEATRAHGADWIITDHHTAGGSWPAATAVIHPFHGDYPERFLSGVGVAFKLAQALLDAVPFPTDRDASFLDGLLKLVALGTVADMVPLMGENALLVKRGLAALSQGNGPGLTALLAAAKTPFPITAQAIAFGLGPRLNAAGRMGGAESAVELLLTRDPQAAQELAEELEALNTERRHCQEALRGRLPAAGPEPFDLQVEAQAHKGVIGIVAGQRMRESGKPTAVCMVQDGVVHGSLRAPDGFDLVELLDLARPYLRSGGGHRAAAGISFELGRLGFVRRTLNQGAQAQLERGISRSQGLDGIGTEGVPTPEELARLEPFGQAFPSVAIALRGILKSSPKIFADKHLKVEVQGVELPVVHFGATPSQWPAAGAEVCFEASPLDHPRFGRQWRFDGWLGQEVLG